jgi:hypothetical protein
MHKVTDQDLVDAVRAHAIEHYNEDGPAIEYADGRP